MNEASLRAISEVLDQQHQLGRTIQFWWRDDDAVRHTPDLETLLILSEQLSLPVAIAAIPELIEQSLVDRLQPVLKARLLVHGFRHADHATGCDKRAEFGAHRPLPMMAEECRRGLSRLRTTFGSKTLDVFVPPWNRIAPGLAVQLAREGYTGLSTFGSRREATFAGLSVINTHLDPVDWRGSRSAVEIGAMARALSRALEMRDGSFAPEAIGILTHHLSFDQPLWSLSAALLEMLRNHPCVRFPPLDVLWHTDGAIEPASSFVTYPRDRSETG